MFQWTGHCSSRCYLVVLSVKVLWLLRLLLLCSPEEVLPSLHSPRGAPWRTSGCCLVWSQGKTISCKMKAEMHFLHKTTVIQNKQNIFSLSGEVTQHSVVFSMPESTWWCTRTTSWPPWVHVSSPISGGNVTSPSSRWSSSLCSLSTPSSLSSLRTAAILR